jgi:DHA1 family inner membrane transport protein
MTVSNSGGGAKLPKAVYSLGLGGIGIGLAEFAIAGILPNISRDFHISSARASQLVSGYAVAVAVGGVFFTSLFAKSNRKIAFHIRVYPPKLCQ